MREKEVRVSFQPSGRATYVLEGTCLVEAAAGAGLALDLPCGGEGICGKCRVIVRAGTSQPGPSEEGLFSATEIQEGHRLACQSVVRGPATVEVPETSLVGSFYKILTQAERSPVGSATPSVVKKYVQLEKPSRGDDMPDVARIQRVAGPLEIDLAVMRELPGRLRQQGFEGTLVVANGRLVALESGNTESRCLAAAFDLGTTTLVGALLDVVSGGELAVTTRLNPQTSFGDDVLSRIQHATECHDGLSRLREAVTQAIDEMIGVLADEAGTDRETIYDVALSGNTTMQQLLCGIDPQWLGQVPFVPATRDRIVTRAADLGLHVHPQGRAYVMPVIGGFVGGDTVSGILASCLAESEGPALLVDIGTNGEMVLFCEGKLLAASTAAGPAFEGARISHGMRGAAGAIEKVVVDGSLRTNVIGDVPPVGLCGSALIDLAAELLRHRVLTSQGRLSVPDGLPQNADLRRRLIADDGQVAFLLADPTETGTGKPIVVTQRDFRELQLATGAIRAGIAILLKRAGLVPGQLERVLIAGGFGNFIRRSNAQRIGLLPQEIPRHRILYQGNTSLAGARLAALCSEAREAAQRLAHRTEHVDLSADRGFHQAFAEAMIFPQGE